MAGSPGVSVTPSPACGLETPSHVSVELTVTSVALAFKAKARAKIAPRITLEGLCCFIAWLVVVEFYGTQCSQIIYLRPLCFRHGKNFKKHAKKCNEECRLQPEVAGEEVKRLPVRAVVLGAAAQRSTRRSPPTARAECSQREHCHPQVRQPLSGRSHDARNACLTPSSPVGSSVITAI